MKQTVKDEVNQNKTNSISNIKAPITVKDIEASSEIELQHSLSHSSSDLASFSIYESGFLEKSLICADGERNCKSKSLANALTDLANKAESDVTKMINSTLCDKPIITNQKVEDFILGSKKKKKFKF